MAKVKRKRRHKINWLRFIGALLVVALIGVAAVSVRTIIELSAEKSRLRTENAELTQQKKDLEAELKSVNDLDYIEEQARKQLKMVKPGEVLYVIDDSGDNAEEGGGGTAGSPEDGTAGSGDTGAGSSDESAASGGEG